MKDVMLALISEVAMALVVARSAVEEDLIRFLAYKLWEDAERPHGRDMTLWLDAEAELVAEGRVCDQPLALPFVFAFVTASAKSTSPLVRARRGPPKKPLPIVATSDYRNLPCHGIRLREAMRRVARVIERSYSIAFCGPDQKMPVFLEWKDPSDRKAGVQIKRDYARALLEPTDDSDLIASIEQDMTNDDGRCVSFALITHSPIGSVRANVNECPFATQARLVVEGEIAEFAYNLLSEVVPHVAPGHHEVEYRTGAVLRRSTIPVLWGRMYLLCEWLEEFILAIERRRRASRSVSAKHYASAVPELPPSQLTAT